MPSLRLEPAPPSTKNRREHHAAKYISRKQPPSHGRAFRAFAHPARPANRALISSPRIAHTEYIHPQDEWVLLLQGQAALDVAGKTVALQSGDYLFIPAHTPHTVLEVSDGAVWLAVHIGGGV